MAQVSPMTRVEFDMLYDRAEAENRAIGDALPFFARVKLRWAIESAIQMSERVIDLEQEVKTLKAQLSTEATR